MAVTFISNGYDTTTANPYTEAAWAWAHPSIGLATYGVRSATHWKVTAVAGQDRTVSINAGEGFGTGVTDKTFENETIQLDTITSGSRWDLIAVRRDWTPTGGESKFVKVNGGATPVIPGGRQATIGNIDDQPLALVQVTAGQTQPTAIIGLRTWAGNGGGLVAEHDLVRSFLNSTGTRLWIDGVDWIRKVGANDVPEWVAYPLERSLNGGAATDITVMRGTWVRAFATGPRRPRVWSSDGITAHITGLVQYKGSNAEIAVIPAPYAPTDGSAITHVGSAQASGAASTSGGPSIDYGIEGGILKVIYQSGTLPTNAFFPLHGSWLING